MRDEIMRHATEEELVLFYYGEGEGIAEHVKECESCRHAYQKLQRTLNAVDTFPVPERSPLYEQELWNRVSPQLPKPQLKRPVWRSLPAWGVAAALVIGAFFLGRIAPPEKLFPQGKKDVAEQSLPAEGSARVIQAAVGDHLERSQMVLAELLNSSAPLDGTRDISYEQQVAEELVDANRLFRVAADTNGDKATAALLDDLERVLLEIAHTPAEVTRARYQELQQSIDDQELLFKVRVYQKQLREREKTI